MSEEPNIDTDSWMDCADCEKEFYKSHECQKDYFPVYRNFGTVYLCKECYIKNLQEKVEALGYQVIKEEIPDEGEFQDLLIEWHALESERYDRRGYGKRADEAREDILNVFRTLKNSNKLLGMRNEELRDTLERYRKHTEFLEDSIECHEDAMKEMEGV